MFRFFRHYIPAHILFLVALEALIMVVSVYLGVSTRFLDTSATISGSVGPLLPKAVTFTTVMLVVMSALGMYHWEWVDGLWGMALRMAMSFIIGFAVMSLIFYVFPALFLGRGAFLISCAIALVGVGLARLSFFRWLNLDVLKRRTLVLGTGSRASKVEALVKTDTGEKRLHIVGYLPLQGTHHYVEHARVLPDSGSVLDVVEKYNIDEVVIAVRDRRGGGLPISDLLECKLRGISVVELSTFFEREMGQLQLESLNASWMILSEGFHQGLVRDMVKRVFDLVVSGLVLVSTLPIMLLTAIAIRMESAGPILYRQERVGQHGKHFTIFKFRSMQVDAEANGTPQWANANDARVTKIGRFIRKLRIDELPQLFNVFMGEMSFVGPRPERPFFVEKLTEEIPYFACRHSVKPGITGWAQVKYQYGASVEDAIEKLQYDLYYIKNHSLFLDLMIIFQTAQVVIWGRGAR